MHHTSWVCSSFTRDTLCPGVTIRRVSGIKTRFMSLKVSRPLINDLYQVDMNFFLIGPRDWASRLWFTHSSLGHTCKMDWLMFSSGPTFPRGLLIQE